MPRKTKGILKNGFKPLVIAVMITLLAIALRAMGAWQLLELKAYDIFFELRPAEPLEHRIVIVALEENEIKNYGWPVSDRTLAQLINKINAQQPSVIGLSIFRDVQVEPGYSELAQVFQTTPNLIGIQKVFGNQFEKVAPPSVLDNQGRTSASDLIVDPDGVVRRYLLFPAVPPQRDLPSLGLAVAMEYLVQERDIKLAFTNGLEIAHQPFPRVTENEGGYVGIDDGGYQILLNYREPSLNFRHVSFSEVLDNQIDPNFFKNRIVLIGSAAPSTQDLYLTPYSLHFAQVPDWARGVEIHAQAASQILSSVLDKRPLIKSLSDQWEWLWIFGWITTTALWIWQHRKTLRYRQFVLIVVGKALVLSTSLFLVTILSFWAGWWLPVVPVVIGVWASTIIVTGYIYIGQLVASRAELAFLNLELQQSNETLEARVNEQTQELRQINQQLTQAFEELETLKEQQIEVQKSALLGSLADRLVHEIKNPVSIVFNQAQLSLDDLKLLKSKIEDNKVFLSDIEDVFIELEQIIVLLDKKISVIDAQGRRTSKIINQVLDFARQESPAPKNFSLVDINGLMTESFYLVCQERQSRKLVEVSLKTDYDYSIEKIEVVLEHIRGALINLINNAWDALEVKKQQLGKNFQPTISFKTQDCGNWVELTVQDNGEGIPATIVPEIFKLFFSTKKSSGKGTGLGLFFVKQIIENEHRGKIKVITQAGQYTKFTLLLPKQLNAIAFRQMPESKY